MALTPGLQLPFGIQPVNPTPVDAWSGPYSASNAQDAIDAANSAIPAAIRYQSMEVRLIVGGVSKKYWYRDGIADVDLVEFASGSGSSGGSGSVLTELVLNESPAGTMDGINKIFTLASDPSNSSAVMLWLNGQLLTQGSGKDFSVAGRSIDLSNTDLTPGDVLAVMYPKTVVVKKFALNESAGFITVSGSLGLQIEKTPDPAQSLMLFRNGQLLTQGLDYLLSGKHIEMIENFIGSDDIFLATYSHID